MMAKGDATGWKRGAGPYSRDYAKFNTDGQFPTLARQHAHEEKPIEAGVAKRGDTNSGFSGEVNSGRRPAHKQGSWKRA